MFIFSTQDAVLTSRDYRFANGKSITSRECRSVAPQSNNALNKGKHYDFALAENPQYFRFFGRSDSAFYFSKTQGLILPSYVLEQVSNQYLIRGTLVYLESLGSQLLVVIYDSAKGLLLDSIYDFNSMCVDSAMLEVKAAINHSTDSLYQFVVYNGIELLKDQEKQSLLNLDNPRYKPHYGVIHNPKVELTKEGWVSNGVSSKWQDLIPISTNNESESVNSGLSKSFKVRISNRGIATELTLRHFLGKEDKVNSKRITLDRNKVKSIQTKVYMGCLLSVVAVYFGIQYTQHYLHQQEIAAQEAMKALQLMNEDPWRDYRNEVTNGNKNLQAEFGLKSLGTVLRAMRNANTKVRNQIPLGWVISSLEMTGPVMTITPYRSGGSYTQLRNFADKHPSFRLRFGESGPQLDTVTLNYPIDDSALPSNKTTFNNTVYITNAEDETAYIADAMSWLFDDIELTTENRLVSGNGESQYRTHLVKLGFKCWMAEDFIYASTQFAYRNYSLHSAKLTNQSIARLNEKGEIEGNTQCDFGFSGEFYLKVFGK